MITSFKIFENSMGSKESLTDEQVSFLMACLKDGTWKVNNLGLIDIVGRVTIPEKILKIPVQFGTIIGTFNCSNTFISTLNGCPINIVGSFVCNNNKSLINLVGGPKDVAGDYSCKKCKNLTSLKGSPNYVRDNFSVRNNENLKSLAYGPKKIDGTFYYENCPLISPEELKICDNDKLREIWYENGSPDAKAFLHTHRGAIAGSKFNV